MNIALPSKELFLEKTIEYVPKNFNLHVWIKDKKGGEKAFGGQINIPLNINSSFMDAIKTIDYLCFHYTGPEIPLGRKEYQAIFVLFDSQTNEVGTWESPLSFPDFEKNKQGAIINCVLGLLASNPKKGRESFSISRKDGSLEYDQIKFLPSVTNRFQRMGNASVFLQIYLPQGKIEVHPRFQVSGKERQSQRLPGEIVAESWKKKSKVWSGIFNINLSTVFFGDYTLKVEIPVSEEGPVLSREVNLTKLRY